MNYGQIANEIAVNRKSYNSQRSIIDHLHFSDVWSGSAHDQLVGTDLNTCVNNMDKVIGDLKNYETALNKTEQYKKDKEWYDKCQEAINNAGENDDVSLVVAKMLSLKAEMSTLKSEIKNCLSSIAPISSVAEKISYTLSNITTPLFDVSSLLAKFTSGSLSKIADGDSLYSYYSREDIDNYIADIKSNSTGRDAAVNCALGYMSLAAEVGKKLDYDFGGGHGVTTTNADVAYGVDCSAFASWCINQGSKNGFNTMATGGLIGVGNNVRYEEAQKGDLLVYHHGDSGHAMIIVDNDPTSQTFTVAEAANPTSGVVLSTKRYSDLSGTYYAKDLSDIYDC